MRSASSDELLQLGRLGLTLLLFHFLDRSEVLQSVSWLCDLFFISSETYVAGVEDSGILFLDFREDVTLQGQQPVHVADEAQILLVLGRLANGGTPFFNQFEDLVLDTGWTELRSLWKPAD